jgi:5-methylcytosine-specific restriction endonuclease McrBC regulatory subunit McrC
LVISGSTRSQRPIFEMGSGRYTANPDLVISKGAEVLAIGDVKYKSWSGSASADDIYQLLVHAAAFRCSLAFLIFPGESLEIHDLGLASTGCRTWVVVVDVCKVDEHLGKFLSTLGPAMGMTETILTATR